MSKVNFIHRRLVKGGVVHNSGGSTIAFRELSDGSIEYAVAFCSMKDNFNKKYGRTKAEGRLNSPNERHVSDMGWADFIEKNSSYIHWS
jgi:hypothetical protein